MRGIRDPYGSRGRWLAAAAAAAGLVLAACSGGSSGPSRAQLRAQARAQARAEAAHAAPLITLADGSGNVSTGAGITVRSSGGTIRSVQVTQHGAPVSGTLTATPSHAQAVWHSTWALHTGRRYTVTATAVAKDGRAVTRTSTFRTLEPARTFSAHIYEGYHQVFGVGMPIILTFSQPIRDRTAVERAMQIRSSKPVVGAWYWDGNETLYFRPRNYWPPHTTVSFDGHLDGVAGAPGMYGTADLTQTFTIGRSLIVTASTANHHMHVYRDGHLMNTWPISTGAPGDDTPNGTYLTIDKGNPVLMSGPGYTDFPVPWSVRFTWSGDYLHDAYWSVGEQGFINVSHGCVNMPPAAAEKYYLMEHPGDPVMITGSPLAGTWGDGWTVWFLSWKQLLKGSALGKAVQAGPDGSTFVSPSSIPPSTATWPLQTATPHSAAAS